MKAATITLNPAIDRTMLFHDRFRTDILNRAYGSAVSAGGKGINVSRMLKIMGVSAPIYGFCGGYNGIILSDMLKKDGLECRFTDTKAETRVNIKLIDDDGICTEANEAGGPIETAELEELFESVIKHTGLGKYVFMGGSIPQGVEKGVYNSLISSLKNSGAITILDCDGEALRQGIKSGPSMIKPNLFELSQFVKKDIKSNAEAVDAAYCVYLEYGADVLCTLGGEGAIYAGKNGLYTVNSPKIKVKNFSGAGDTFLAAYTFEYDRSRDVASALVFASSTAAARVERNASEQLSFYDMKKFVNELTVEKLK